MAEKVVYIEGMDEWRKAMRRVDLQDRVKDTNFEVGRYVTLRAEGRKALMRGRYPSYRRVTFKAGRAQASATVTIGPKGFGIASEFGANVHPVYGRGYPQSGFVRRVWPVHNNDGYLVHPVLRSDRAHIEDMYMEAMAAELRPAFPGR